MLAAVLAVSLVVAPGVAAEEESRAFAELIDAAANRGEFESALRLVDEAQRLHPHHRWHFFRASILAETGACQEAVVEYDAYLAAESDPANVASAEDARSECAEQEPPAAPEQPPPPAAATPASPVSPEPSLPAKADARPAPWKRDAAAISLLASGFVIVGVGAVLTFQAARRRDVARNADVLDTFDAELRAANRLRVAGIVSLAVGAALVVGGAIRFGIVAARHRKRKTACYRLGGWACLGS